jgi:PilZ domain
MKKRPFILTLYSLILVGAAASFPMQVVFAYEIPVHKIFQAFQYLTWLNFTVIVSMLATSIAVVRASRITVVLAPATVLLVCMNNYWVGYVGINYSSVEATIASVAFAALTCFLLERKSRQALFNPQSHWWQTPRRKHIQKPIVLLPWKGETMSAFTHDISESGAFVRSAHITGLAVGDCMQLRMKIKGHIAIRCTGRLVRKSEAAGQYPQGLAIRFEDLSRRERKMIRDLVYS